MKERDISGVKNAARFAIQPNMNGFCGEKTDQKILRDFVAERNTDEATVLEILCHHGFPHLNAFLNTIAEKAKKDPYDIETVNSYWIGNDLTEKIGTNTRSTLAKHYSEQFIKAFGNHLNEVLPDRIYLTHLSQVILIATMDHEPDKNVFINRCMVAWGKITDLDPENKTAKIIRDILRETTNGRYEVVSKTQLVMIDSDLTSELAIGDEVAVHLGYLAQKISTDQAKKLQYWTRKVVSDYL